MHNHPAKKRHRLPLILLLTTILIATTTLTLFHLIFSSEFNRRVKKLSAEGFPVSLDDLEKTYILPKDAENAADLYIKAFDAYVYSTEQESQFLPYGGNYKHKENSKPLPPEVIAAIESFLQKNHTTLQFLDKASIIEHCMYPRTREIIQFSKKYSNGFKITAQLLSNRNMYLAQTQQTNPVFESTQTLLSLSDSLYKQPFLYDYLLTLALQVLAANSLEHSLNFANFSDEQLSTLHRKYRKLRQTDFIGPAMITERVKSIEFFNLPVTEQTNQMFAPAPLYYLYSISSIKKKDTIKILDCYEVLIEAAKLPSSEQLIQIEEFLNDYDGTLAEYFSLFSETSNEKIINIAARVTGNLLCAESALAIERYRLKYKTLPDSLDQLIPEFMEEIPIDPFDANPIRYRQLENSGYTLYTIGYDRKDNNGLDKDQMKEINGEYPIKHDWPFTVKRSQNHKN